MNADEHRPPGCENCKKACVIHLTQIINGEVKKMDMCETCPHAAQLQDPTQFGLMEKLLGIAMQKGIPLPSSDLTCPHCGYKESEFRKTGRLGCPECYNIFVTPQMHILSKIQEAEVHKGKGPKNQDKRDLRLQLAQLKKNLMNYIEQEEYERAAQIRDQIKQINAQLAEKLENNRDSEKIKKPEKIKHPKPKSDKSKPKE